MRINWELTGKVWKLRWLFKQQPEIKWNLYTYLCSILLQNKNRNQLEIVLKATYGLHPNKYLKILDLTFWGRSLVTRRFGLPTNSRGADEIKGLPISIDFPNRITELLLLFSIISPCITRGTLRSCTFINNSLKQKVVI